MSHLTLRRMESNLAETHSAKSGVCQRATPVLMRVHILRAALLLQRCWAGHDCMATWPGAVCGHCTPSRLSPRHNGISSGAVTVTSTLAVLEPAPLCTWHAYVALCCNQNVDSCSQRAKIMQHRRDQLIIIRIFI
jgi:hypothetical protein